MKRPGDINESLSDAINFVSKFVVPLYVDGGNRPSLIGSGFFVQFDGNTAMVSAAHVLNQISDKNPLFAFRKPDEVVQIGGKRYLSDPNGLDLGFIVTDGIQLPWPEVDRLACQQEHLYPHRTPRRIRHYVIAGYPETKNRPSVKNKTIEALIHAYHATSIDDEEYRTIGLNPRDSIALPLDRKRAYSIEGEQINFPKPNGMSGSPIWELFTDPPGSNEPRVFPLVGVATTYRNKTLFGTDIGYLLSRLQTAA